MTCTDITEFFSHTQNLKILLKNRTMIWTSTFCRLHYKTVASISLKTPPSCLILFRVGKSEQARERKLREKTEERFPLCRHLALGPKLSALGQGRYLRTCTEATCHSGSCVSRFFSAHKILFHMLTLSDTQSCYHSVAEFFKRKKEFCSEKPTSQVI